MFATATLACVTSTLCCQDIPAHFKASCLQSLRATGFQGPLPESCLLQSLRARATLKHSTLEILGLEHIFRTSPLDIFIHICSRRETASAAWHMLILSGRVDDLGWFRRWVWLQHGDNPGAVFMEPRPVQFNSPKTHLGRRCK